jgi:hypothetical protein
VIGTTIRRFNVARTFYSGASDFIPPNTKHQPASTINDGPVGHKMTAESDPESCSSLDQDSDQSSHRSSDANISGEEDRQSAQIATNDTDIPSQEILVSDASIDMLTANGLDDDMKTSEGSCIVGGSSKEQWVNTGSPGQRSIRQAKYQALGVPLPPYSSSETAASPVAVLQEFSADLHNAVLALKRRQLDALDAPTVDELRDYSSFRREQSRSTVPMGHVFADALVLGDEHDSPMPPLPVQSI